MVTLYKVACTEEWIKILGVMIDMISKNAGMIFVDFVDFIGTL